MPENLVDMKLAVSGAKECQQQIASATASVKSMQSALKLADSEMKMSGESAAGYTKKIQILQNQIAAQTQAVEAARQGLATISAAFGENSTRAAQWQTKLNNAQTALNNMKASMNDMQSKLSSVSGAMSSTAGAAGSLAGALSGMAGGSYSMDGLNSSLAGSQTEIQKTSDQLAELQNQVKETGGLFYNVGNMSISAANGGKVASAISSIAKGMDSVVKSAAETASHTDDLGSIILGGMSGGTMTAGGVMSTVGGVVSNFGPWGAVAGAVLNLGGSIADAVSEGIERREKARREEEYNAYWNSGVDKAALESLAAAMSRSDDIVASMEASVKATVTANVGDLRVVIEQATEDGHVDRHEVGAVKKYVQEVLLADYDDAVFELMRMRGELWVLATQGYTPEEVAMYGDMSKPENSNLYLFLKSFLGDDQNSYIQQFFDNDEQVQNAATNLWLFMAKKFGSADAMVEAFKDPEQKDVVQGFISEWLQATFGSKGLSLSKANLTAANLMTRLWSLIDMEFSGSNADKSGNWFGNTEGGGLFVQWMQSILTEGDKQDALDYARDMWIDVIAAATDPEAAVQTLHDTSGADAAADYRAGKKTNAAAQFGAMVDWVMKTLKISDKNRAIEIAIEMWDQVRHAASYGVSGTGTLTLDTSWITETPAGTTFQDWVAANLTEGDKEKAEKTAKDMWASVVAAASSPEAAVGSIYSATGEEAAAAAKDNPDSAVGSTFNAFLAWVNKNYPELDAEAAEKEAIRLWNAVRASASYGTSNGTKLTPDTSWITTTQAGTIFSDWVRNLLPESDKNSAVAIAEGLWAEVVAAASSPAKAIETMSGTTGEEAAKAAEEDPESDAGKMFNRFLAWVQATCPEKDAEAARLEAIRLWNEVRMAAATGSASGTVLTADTSWILTTAAGTTFTDWIAKVLPEANKNDAVKYAQGLWADVIAAASSPEGAIGALSSATGEEAAAAAASGEDSDTAKAFNAMVQWVQNTLGEDHEAAVRTAIGMWDSLRAAAFSGIDESGTNHTTTKTGSYTFSGSEAMRNYIAQVMGTDFEAAISSANDYWDRLIKAVKGDTAQTDGKDLRSDLLKQALEEYKKTLDEINKVTEEMEGAQGDDLDEKIAYLEKLLNQAETLGKRIEMLRKGLDETEGAYNLVTYGKSNVSEEDVATAFAYMKGLKNISDQSYADAVAQAEKDRQAVYQKYNPDRDNSPEAVAAREAAEKAYTAAVQQAEADYKANKDTYATMMVELMNAVLTKQGEGNIGTERALVLEMFEKGLFEGLTAADLKSVGGPLGKVLESLFESAYVVSENSEGKEATYSGYGYLPEVSQEGTTFKVGGKTYNSVGEIPLWDLIHELYGSKVPGGAGKTQKQLEDEQYLETYATLVEVGPPAPVVTVDGKNGGGVRFGDDEEQGEVEVPVMLVLPVDGVDEFADDASDDLEEAGAEAGANLANSLAAAITENAGAPESAARSMAARIDRGVRDTLGIASPSKVMLAYGEYTAMGLAEGIDASMAMVTRASRRMASAVVSPMSDAAASAGRTVNNSATSSLYIDKYYQRSDADVDSLAAAIADKNRLGRYGNGLRN